MVTTSRKHSTVSEYGVVSTTGVEYESFEQQYSNILAGVGIFKSVFSSYPRSTIPPHDVSNSGTLLAFAKVGVSLVQSERRRLTSILGLDRHGPGTPIEALKRGLLQLSAITRTYRNMRLENGEKEEPSALRLASIIFKMGSPVIAGTHRQNYVGSVDSDGADRGRKRLREFLTGLCENPRLFFLTASEASQLSSRGYSVERFGDELLVRNYTRGDLTLHVLVGPRHQIRDLAREHAGGIESRLLDNGTKVYIPKGRTVSVTGESVVFRTR
jgi:hypothetical protein